ncbi:MAG: hypothetical protein M3R27_08075 [Bacteroidota bacterium]|nr:hypothetical protein [Bacteroidota bacterium]
MKKILLILALFFGIQEIGTAQTSTHQGEDKSSSKKFRKGFRKKQTSHFDQMKKDKAIRYNGTSYWQKQKSNKYKVDGNGKFKSAKPYKKKKVKEVKTNQNFE